MQDSRTSSGAFGADACGASSTLQPIAEKQRVLLEVSGMDCDTSLAVVQCALFEVAGVLDVRCDAPGNSVWVRFDATSTAVDVLPLTLARKGFPSRLVMLQSGQPQD